MCHGPLSGILSRGTIPNSLQSIMPMSLHQGPIPVSLRQATIPMAIHTIPMNIHTVPMNIHIIPMTTHHGGIPIPMSLHHGAIPMALHQGMSSMDFQQNMLSLLQMGKFYYMPNQNVIKTFM